MGINTNMEFRICTVGWEPYFINDLLLPISTKTDIDFVNGLVGDASRIKYAQQQYPQLKFVSLSKTKEELLPEPDYEMLAGLESLGVQTVKSMIQGDRVLRHRPAHESLAYATLLVCQMRTMFEKYKPDVVLGTYDSMHSALGQAVAKSLGIPWVAMAFTVIPDNLTGFCKALTPDKLVPLERSVDGELKAHAKEIIQNVRRKKQKVLAYRSPTSLMQWVRQYIIHGRNLFRRKQKGKVLGIDRFTYPSPWERICDISRRSFNRFRLPTSNMLNSPPEGRFVYYPFHMAPESMLDTWAPFYQNQLAFVAQLSLSIPVDVSFVIKLHFSDPDNYSRKQLRGLMNIPNLRIAHPDAPGNEFIEKASLVVGITGTSSLEAALYGKPALIFGDSPYQHFPRSERAKRPDQLYEQIHRLLALPPPSDDEVIEAFSTYMARYMPGRINDWERPITDDELDRLVNCFNVLRIYVMDPDNYAKWYQQPPFVRM